MVLEKNMRQLPNITDSTFANPMRQSTIGSSSHKNQIVVIEWVTSYHKIIKNIRQIVINHSNHFEGHEALQI